MATSIIKKPQDFDGITSEATSTGAKIKELALVKDSQGYYIQVFVEGQTSRVGYFRILSP